MKLLLCSSFFLLLCTFAFADDEENIYGCNFERNNFCEWTVEESEAKEWTVEKAALIGTVDHTLNTGTGHVLISFENGKIGDRAQLVSPWINGGERCLTFFLKAPKMTGASLIVFGDFGIFKSALQRINITDSTNWQLVEVPVGLKHDINYHVVIEALMESKNFDQILLDDIQLSPGSC